MIKQLSLAGAALAMSVGTLVPSAADAQRYGGHGQRHAYRDGYNQGPRNYRGEGGRYRERRDGRCNSGTTGTILGAIAGGLLGRSIDTRGDRAVGTVLGAGAGALAGNAVEKSGNRGYCR
jgi:uncharacterized protein YcfJ